MVKQKINVMNEDEIKEVEFEVNTLQTGTATHITDKINGEIECIIVDTNASIQMSISFAEMSSIVLFDTGAITLYGQIYIPIRTDTFSKTYERYNFSNSKWVINNKLRFEIIGPYNSSVRIIVRYK